MHASVIALTPNRVSSHRERQHAALQATWQELLNWLTGEAAVQPIHVVAAGLQKRLTRLALAGLSLWSALRLDETVPKMLVHGHASYSFHAWRWEPVRTRFGVFDSLEPAYVCVAGKGPRRLLPHGRRMGLADGRMSLGVHVLVANLAARMPFKAVSEVADAVGMWVPGRRAMLGIVDRWGPDAITAMSEASQPDEMSEGTHVVIEQDDGGIPHVRPEELAKRRRPNKRGSRKGRKSRLEERRRRRGRRVDRRRRRKGDKSKNCCMATVYVVYTLLVHADGTVEGPLNRQVFAATRDKARLRKRVLQAAKARGWGVKPSIYLADGATTHWKAWKQVFHEGAPCIDWFHVAEYFWTAADAVFRVSGRQPQGKRARKAFAQRKSKAYADKAQWVRARQDELLAGDVEKALDALRKLTDRVGASGPGTHARRKAIRDAITYVDNHKEYMPYATLGHIVMGTGVVEATIKQLGARMKGPGMRWSVERAERVVALRCLQLSSGDAWARFVERVVQAHESVTSLHVPAISPTVRLTAHTAARKAA